MQPGSRLGPYAIVAPLGAGGMGEVFRATDTRLGREVALKRLPGAFASDPERLARFEREAKLLASLSHPNVATLFGLEEIEGQRLLVMELVPGEDLAERLRRGPVPVDEALGLARHVAEALEAAHEKGIVHRDLKPANVKLKPDGTAKVLDFGLAKAWSDDAAGGSDPKLSQSPTLAHTGTAAGVILGTAAYMSPEQARGKAVDRRADIWAFGVVLFEMLSGRRLFDGETVSDVLAAVLTRDLDFAPLPAGTPPSIRELLRRCLVRDPRHRLQSIGDARIVLEEAVRSGPTASQPLDSTGTRTAPRRRLAAAWLPWLLVFGLAGVLALSRGRSLVGPALAVEILPPPGTAYDLRDRGPGPVAFSPDGTRLAFAAQDAQGTSRLHVRDLADGRTSSFPGSEGAQFPFWSPDGRWIAFFTRIDGTLKKVPAEGGAPLTLCRALNGKGGSWGAGERIVFAPYSGAPLHAVPAAGGESRPITTLSDRHNSHRHPRFLPDGRRFLFLARGRSSGDSAVMLGSVDGAPPREVLRSTTQAEYASGELLFVRESVLMAQPFDLGRGVAAGEARRVAEGVAEMREAAYAAFSASQAGRLAFHSGETQAPVRVELRDRAGALSGTLGPLGEYRRPTLSPDGRRVAASASPAGQSRNSDIWILETASQLASRLTIGPAEDMDPVWTSDGRALIFSSNPNGPHDLFRKGLDGTGATEALLVGPGIQKPSGVSSDGRFVLVNNETQEGSAVVILDLASGQARPLREGRFNDANAQLSDDGRWLLYDSDESGRPEVYVTTFPEPRRTWQASTNGGRYPFWGRAGREVLYADLAGQVVATPVVFQGETLSFGTAATLFRTAPPTRDYPDWTPSRDGTRFVVVPTGVREARNELRLVVNWPARLGAQ